MSKRSEMLTTMIEPVLYLHIERKRGHETRSSFVRRILVDWYNKSEDTTDKLEE